MINEFIHSTRSNFIINSPSLYKDGLLVNELFKRSELDLVLSKQTSKSSPGIDTIPYSLFVHSPENIKNFFLNIINNIWISSNIPILWKTSIIKPILKNKKTLMN